MVNRISGFSSGMDIDMMVSKLMQAERVPVDKLNQKKTTLEWSRDAYREFNSKVLDFRNNKVFNMRMEGTFLARKVDITGNSAAITAKSDNNAIPGSLTIKVDKLAKTATDLSDEDIRSDSKFDPSAVLSTQSSKLKSYNGSWTSFKINGKEITIDPNDDSLNSIIEKINKDTDVNAFYDEVTGKLSFVSKKTGLVNNPTDASSVGGKYITFEGSFLTNTFKVTTEVDPAVGTNPNAANDAKLFINGIETTRQGNTFNLNGVTVTLNQEGGSPTTIQVGTDTDKIVESIKTFIKDYNDMLKWTQDKVSEKRYRDFPPLSDEQKKDMKDKEIEMWEEKAKSGLLKNDDILNKAITSMRAVTYSKVETGDSKYNLLSSLGIGTQNYYEDGKLYLNDESKLRKAIEENPDAVLKMFTAKGNGDGDRSDVGLAERMYQDFNEVLKDITTKSGSPSLDSTSKDESYIGKELGKLNERILSGNSRLKQIEDRYYRQFTAMETAMNKFNSQSSFLSQFGGSNGG